MPRKVRNETASSAAAVIDAVVTAMVGSTLRSTCTRITCSFEAAEQLGGLHVLGAGVLEGGRPGDPEEERGEQDPHREHRLDEAVAERGGDRDREEDRTAASSARR